MSGVDIKESRRRDDGRSGGAGDEVRANELRAMLAASGRMMQDIRGFL